MSVSRGEDRWPAARVLAAVLVLGQGLAACRWLAPATPVPDVATAGPNPVAMALDGHTRRVFVL
ncbi:MAG TPA: hypothetical protein VG370_11500, partial [Chloroflexota bacterium]|nr:hypothetical protein [Chloroflexota bacterium]